MIVSVIDVGIGNIASVLNMFRSIGVDVQRVTKPTDAREAELLVLPGVGSFDTGVKHLKSTGWYNFLQNLIHKDKTPLVGICLGMQLMCESSAEGQENGLGLIPGTFAHISTFAGYSRGVRVPHMGWNDVQFVDQELDSAMNSDDQSRFYFVHSYAYEHSSNDFVAGVTHYDLIRVVAVVKRRNVWGFQFHPEKSHIFGKRLLMYVLNTVD